jgi:hypothetical protein
LPLSIQIWWNNSWQPQNGKVSHVQSEEVMVSNRKKDSCDYDAYHFWPWDRSLQEQADWALSLSGHLCIHTNQIQTSFPHYLFPSQPAVPSLSSQDGDVTLPGLRRRRSASHIFTTSSIHLWLTAFPCFSDSFLSLTLYTGSRWSSIIGQSDSGGLRRLSDHRSDSDYPTGYWGGSLVPELYALATTIVILYVHITHLYIWEGMAMIVTMIFWHDNGSI